MSTSLIQNTHQAPNNQIQQRNLHCLSVLLSCLSKLFCCSLCSTPLDNTNADNNTHCTEDVHLQASAESLDSSHQDLVKLEADLTNVEESKSSTHNDSIFNTIFLKNMLLCPITGCRMQDPVVLCNGTSIDGTSLIGNIPVKDFFLTIPNIQLRYIIQQVDNPSSTFRRPIILSDNQVLQIKQLQRGNLSNRVGLLEQLIEKKTQLRSIENVPAPNDEYMSFEEWLMYYSTQPKESFVNSSTTDFHDHPNEFLCPIMSTLMVDPVICSDGQTYDRAAISIWLSKRNRSPLTNLVLTNKKIIPNVTLKMCIDRYREKYQFEIKKVTHDEYMKKMGLLYYDVIAKLVNKKMVAYGRRHRNSHEETLHEMVLVSMEMFVRRNSI